MTYDEILDFPCEFSDTKAYNLREYFKLLLLTLWYEGEGFSGKRPFGNSGWDHDIYAVLVKMGAVDGTFYDDGGLDECDYNSANVIVQQLINHMFKRKKK